MGLIIYPGIAGYKDCAPMGLMDSNAMPGAVYLFVRHWHEKMCKKRCPSGVGGNVAVYWYNCA
jgi:hypothetical protein